MLKAKYETKLAIMEIAATLTASLFEGADKAAIRRQYEGRLEQGEQGANNEVWATFQVFCAGIAASLKEENKKTLGFEALDGLDLDDLEDFDGGDTLVPEVENVIPTP